jgi:hypothetical protein
VPDTDDLSLDELIELAADHLEAGRIEDAKAVLLRHVERSRERKQAADDRA